MRSRHDHGFKVKVEVDIPDSQPDGRPTLNQKYRKAHLADHRPQCHGERLATMAEFELSDTLPN